MASIFLTREIEAFVDTPQAPSTHTHGLTLIGQVENQKTLRFSADMCRETYFSQSPVPAPPFLIKCPEGRSGPAMVPSGGGGTPSDALGGRMRSPDHWQAGPPSSENLDPPYSIILPFLVKFLPESKLPKANCELTSFSSTKSKLLRGGERVIITGMP